MENGQTMKSEQLPDAILRILGRGNTAEIKKRKGEIIIMEVKRTIKETMQCGMEHC